MSISYSGMPVHDKFIRLEFRKPMEEDEVLYKFEKWKSYLSNGGDWLFDKQVFPPYLPISCHIFLCLGK